MKQGYHQGCPLSPTLFALFIEPVVQVSRENSKIKGILVKGIQHQICVNANGKLNSNLTISHQAWNNSVFTYDTKPDPKPILIQLFIKKIVNKNTIYNGIPII